MPHDMASYDAVVSGLVLNFIAQPDQAPIEMAQMAKTYGIVAAYVWDYAGKMQMMRHFWNAAAALTHARLTWMKAAVFRSASPNRSQNSSKVLA